MHTRAEFAGREAVRDTNLAVAVFVTRLPHAGWYVHGNDGYLYPSRKGGTRVETGTGYDYSRGEHDVRQVTTSHVVHADCYYVAHGEPEADGRVSSNQVYAVPAYCSDRNALQEVYDRLADLRLLNRLRDFLHSDPTQADPYDVCVAAIKTVNEKARTDAAKELISQARRIDFGAFPDEDTKREFLATLDHATRKLVPPPSLLDKGGDKDRALDYIAWRCGVTPDPEGWITPQAVANGVHGVVFERDCLKRLLAEVKRTWRGGLDQPLTAEVAMLITMIADDVEKADVERADVAERLRAMLPALEEATRALRAKLDQMPDLEANLDYRGDG